VETQGAEVLAQFADGGAALLAAGPHHYLACWPDADLLRSTLKLLCSKAGLATIDLPEAVRLRRRGPLLFAFNYGDDSWEVPGTHRALLGSGTVPPQGVAVLRAE